MKTDEIKELVRKKRFLIESFYYSITLNKNNSRDNALGMAVTTHFLQAIIIELIIKTLFELNCKETAPYSHNILKIFNNLNQDTRSELVILYDRARIRKQEMFKKFAIPDVQFHPLEKVLKNNELTIKNFKYDAMGNDSNSSLDGMFMTDVFTLFDLKIKEFGA
ncbi:hypothetical protein [Lutibacter profundi]|nr:hypothetical protein [Lutibacter profundi]